VGLQSQLKVPQDFFGFTTSTLKIFQALPAPRDAKEDIPDRFLVIKGGKYS